MPFSEKKCYFVKCEKDLIETVLGFLCCPQNEEVIACSKMGNNNLLIVNLKVSS